MAETALDMATTLVGSALGVASSAAREEMGLLLGVQDDIRFISDELKMMQAFLRAADGARENTGVLKAYLELIRDLAYDIEDSLEEFMVFIKHKSLVQQLLSLRARHRVAVQIRTLKLRVQEVSQRNTRYNLIKLTPSISSDVTQLFGLDKQKEKLTDLIAKLEVPVDMEPGISKSGPRVVSVVGMGGLGKTTLTKKVYDSKDIVSQSFDPKELLKEMIKQLFGAHSLKEFLEEHQGQVLEVKHLTNYLRGGLLERKYLVVLDDVWTLEAWNCMCLVFPENSKDGSCVVLTSRNHKLAEHCSPPSQIYQPEILEEKDARSLFLKKTNKSSGDLDKDDRTKGIVEKILNKRGGLPLAIVTIGGLLDNKDTRDWENLYNQLPSELATNPSLEALRRVVHLSYNHLPSHLKPCFLHLSIFPEDFEIERKHLVDRWVAEGFVTIATNRRTLEEVAESYFYELISRSMIQPAKLDALGNVKTCRVHDIVHDIAVPISSQDNHVFLVEDHTSSTTTSKESIRHISCYAKPMEPIGSLCSSKFKMLRVLDLKNANFRAEQQDIRNIGFLPRCIGNLQALQTLDIRKSIPKGVGSLKELQILDKVDIKRTSRKVIKELGELTQLRKLVVRGKGASKKKCSAFCITVQELSSLRSLNVGTNEKKGKSDGLDMLVSFTSPLPFPSLERLKMKGLLQEMPTWVGKCLSLVKIDLKYCGLKELEAITELPNLMQLRLYNNAYNAEKLVFHKHAFPELRILQLTYSAALREVTFEEGTSPNMENISIQYCRLRSGINGIKHLPKLKEIYTVGCTLAKQHVLQEEVDKHMNRPVLQMQLCKPANPEEETEVKVEVTESISEAGESLQL
ncbi:unnamed protein product [Miscanthus lutarioriparius]|uniref:Uncharacterized protein n=1 Tax=Miscanthus lutarioriparius TaxID=422564 RepID=A0A811SE09_9POAL|nr:unnamed protein product [Miscanthus lutarioriparius]